MTVELSSIRSAAPTQSVGPAQSLEVDKELTRLPPLKRACLRSRSKQSTRLPMEFRRAAGTWMAFFLWRFRKAFGTSNRFPLLQNLVSHRKVLLPLSTSKDHEHGHGSPHNGGCGKCVEGHYDTKLGSDSSKQFHVTGTHATYVTEDQ